MQGEQHTGGLPKKPDESESSEVLRQLESVRAEIRGLRELVLNLAMSIGRTQPIPFPETLEREAEWQARVTDEMMQMAREQGYPIDEEMKVTKCPPGVARGAEPTKMRVPVGPAVGYGSSAPLNRKRCVECGTMFVPNSGVQKYCRQVHCASFGCPPGTAMVSWIRQQEQRKRYENSLK